MLKKQLIRFGLIGLLAFSIHFLSVLCLVSFGGLPPLGANIIGFLLAFQVSYWGHYTWTFTAAHVPHKIAVSRFFIVAFLNFGFNELMYATLLYQTSLSYELALFLVLVFMSTSTFMLSKFWAFR